MVEKKTPVGKPADDFIRIQDLWSMFVPKWYWFAISLFITLTIAVLYLLSTSLFTPVPLPFSSRTTRKAALRPAL